MSRNKGIDEVAAIYSKWGEKEEDDEACLHIIQCSLYIYSSKNKIATAAAVTNIYAHNWNAEYLWLLYYFMETVIECLVALFSAPSMLFTWEKKILANRNLWNIFNVELFNTKRVNECVHNYT